MCPRRRTIPDLALAEHACTLLVEAGAPAVTFAQVSKRGGIAPAPLVQRFGTREGLLTAAASALRGRIAAAFAASRQPSALANLRAALPMLAPHLVASLSLAWLVPLDGYAVEMRKQISFSLAAAIEARELPRCDVAQLARFIQISALGAAATALLERGDPAALVRAALDAHLASYI